MIENLLLAQVPSLLQMHAVVYCQSLTDSLLELLTYVLLRSNQVAELSKPSYIDVLVMIATRNLGGLLIAIVGEIFVLAILILVI